MSASYLARAEDDLSCPLCLELFVDPNTPKQLSCPHVYCQICLEKMVEGGRRAVSCPECRAITRVPPKTPTTDGGIADLKTGIRLRSLAENHLKHTENQLVSPPVETGAKPSSVPTCPDHDDEKMHFYCVTCKVLVCQACIVLDHDKTRHEIKGVKVVYQEKLAEMKQRVKSANDSLKRQNLLKSVTEQEKKVEATMAATEQEIDKAVAEVLMKIPKQGKALKDKNKARNQGQLQVYQQQKKKLEHDIQSLRNITAEVKSTMENASPYEYLMKHGSLEEKIKQVQVDGGGEKMEDIEGAKVFKMVPTPVGKLGDILRVREIEQIQKIEGQCGYREVKVGGMNGTFAVCKSGCVSIFRKQQTGKYEHALDLNVIGSDVAVASNGKILVARENWIRVFMAAGQQESRFHTTNDNTRDIELTSITSLSDGRIAIGDIGRKVLTLHTLGGELIKTINVGFEPRNITAMKGVQVALCDGNGNVYVYDVDTGRQVLIVDVPGVQCVCYDEETNCLMVARYGGMIAQYCVSPWKLINSNKVVRSILEAMIFADKNDLVVSANNRINVYRCTG